MNSSPRYLFIYVLGASGLWLYNPDGFIADDSYFYLVISRNVAQFGEQTFSGIMPTNGVHTLWIWVLSGTAWIGKTISPSLMATPHFMILPSIFCLMIAVFYHVKLYNLLRLRCDGVVLILVYCTIYGVLSSEAHASYAALAFLSCRFIVVERTETIANLAIFGLAALIAFFARLDNIFVSLAALGMIFFLRIPMVRCISILPVLELFPKQNRMISMTSRLF